MRVVLKMAYLTGGAEADLIHKAIKSKIILALLCSQLQQ